MIIWVSALVSEMVVRNLLLVGGGVVVLGLGGCYRPSDEYLKSKGEMPNPTLPTPEAEEAVRRKAEEAAVAGQSSVVAVGESEARPSFSQSDREMGEPEMIDLFARHELEALPELDKAVMRTPGNLEPLMRGAFAGVGNDTEKCQEILLYLVVRHPKMAPQVSATAATLNPEIQSPLQ